MDWKKLIAELSDAGVTQAEIAAECGVAQSTISDLHRGASKSPSFDLGSSLVALHTAKVGRPADDGVSASAAVAQG